MAGITRRTFGCVAGAGLQSLLMAARKKIPIAVQVYSVRKLAEADLSGTLAGIAKIGYAAVEFAGYYNHPAGEMRKMLDDTGLKCAGTHTQWAWLQGEEFAKTIELNKTIGNRNIIVPGLPKAMTESAAAWRDTAKLFNEMNARIKAQGLRLGYHNHESEFKLLEDGQKAWDIFCENTDKDLITQLDIGHTVHAGADPAAYLKRYPKRAKTVHVSDYSATKRGALIGEGDVKWPEVLAACEKVGGTEWYIIEEESSGLPGLQGIDSSLKRLRKLLS